MPISDLLAQISGEPVFSTTALTQPANPLKRRTNDDQKTPIKRIGTSPLAQASKTIPGVKSSSNPQIVSVRRKSDGNGLAGMINNYPEKPATIANTSKPMSHLNKPSTAKRLDKHNGIASVKIPAASSLPAAPKTERTTIDPSKPPKKGSYAEIMARAATLQDAYAGKIGKIQHKPTEKVKGMRERLQHKKFGKRLGSTREPKARTTASTATHRMQSVRKENHLSRPSNAPVLEKKPKKAALATTGYKGTARPARGTNKKSQNSYPQTGYSYGRDGNASGKYGHTSEDEDMDEVGESEEDEDDEGSGIDYNSDASSDMEAAAFEVDEEEEMAARIARREDAAALAEETRHKREKEARKKKLATMARNR